MSLTMKQRRDWVKALGMVYHPEVELTPQTIDLNLQMSRNEQYKSDLRINEFNYRKTITINDGDQLPADFVMYGDEAYYSNSGTNTALAIITVQSLPFVRTGNSLIKGLASQPKLYFANQKINTVPASLSSVSFTYYWRPTDLFNATTPVADNLQDNMPARTEPNIIRGAAERNLLMIMSREQAMQLMNIRAQQAAKVNQEFYDNLVAVSAESTRSSLR